VTILENPLLQSLLTIIGILLVILVPITAFVYNRRRKLKAYYEVMWKNSSALKPREILGIRGRSKYGFHKYYHQRHEDRYIKERIENNQNVLVIGNPLAGKSRAIYQALNTLKKPCDVTIPKLVDIEVEDFRVPLRFSFWRKTILVLDDLDKFLDQRNFMYLFREFAKRNTIIVASCRSGPEYEKLCRRMERELASIFGDPMKISKISKEEGEEVARKTGRKLPGRFDGNIGSIFLELGTMKERFQSCGRVEKGVLRSIKRLYYAGIYRERENFSIKRIRRVCKKREEIESKQYEWTQLLKELENKGFIDISKKEIRAEETYLQFVIEDSFSTLDNLIEMVGIFSDDSEALSRVGSQAYRVGIFDIQKAKYAKVAIEACNKALKIRTFERFPIQYAVTQNSLGIAYHALAEVENKPENCKKAIEACNKALNVYTLEKFPIDYAMAQINLGNAYVVLAEFENTPENCRNAIEAINKALNVYTLEKFPIRHGVTQNNLGIAYEILAGVENTAENCKKAIEALNKALKIRTFERFPIQYAVTQNNLGNAYCALAKVENKPENCKKAIEAYNRALKVYTKEKFPIGYAMAQNNLEKLLSFCGGK